MAKTSLIVKALDSNGKLLQKTVTDVNPDATNETLAAFGQKVNALTTHTYSGTDRVDKVNCDTEATPEDTRLDNTITLGDEGQTSPNITMTQLKSQSGFSAKVNTTNGTPYISWVAMNVSASIYESGVTPYVQVKSVGNPTAGVIATIAVDGDETYKPATLDITLTN